MWAVFPPSLSVPSTLTSEGQADASSCTVDSGGVVSCGDAGQADAHAGDDSNGQVLPQRRGALTGEVGVVVAYARMWQEPVGTVTGTFVYLDTPVERVTGVNVSFWDGTAWRLPLLTASEPVAGTPAGFLAPGHGLHRLDMTHGDFAPFADSHGNADLPAWQTVQLTTGRYRAIVDFRSAADEFVRLVVPYKDAAGVRRVCSDFRAAQTRATVTLDLLVTPAEAAFLGGEESAATDVAAAESLWRNLCGGNRAAAPVCTTTPPVQPAEVAALRTYLSPHLSRCYPVAADSTDWCLSLLRAPTLHNAVEFAYHAPFAVGEEAEAALRRAAGGSHAAEALQGYGGGEGDSDSGSESQQEGAR